MFCMLWLMSGPLAEYRKNIFNNLFAAVQAYAVPEEIEVAKTGDAEFQAKKLSAPKGDCAVELLDDGRTFSAGFGWAIGARSISPITFNVSEEDASVTVPAAMHVFQDVSQAAQWLIDTLRALS
jgi:hypothetical protein